MSDHLPPEDPQPAFPPAPGAGSVASSAPTTEQPARRRGAVIAIVVAIVLIVVCSGGALAYFKMRGGPIAVLDKVPAGADVVFVAHLDPAASQKANLFRLTARFPDLGSKEQLAQKFDDLIDEGLSEQGLSHEDLDWIGGEVGGYAEIGLGQPSFALILAVDDEGAARSALDELQRQASGGSTPSTSSVSGVDVSVGSDGSASAVFDGVAVLASDENAMRSVIDTAEGASNVLGDEVYTGVIERLPADNLGSIYVNVHELVGLIGSIPAGVAPELPSMSQLEGIRGVGYSVTAEPDGLAIDGAVTTDPTQLTAEQRDALAAGDEPTPLLSRVPADAYAVLASSGAQAAADGIDRSLAQVGELDRSAARTIERLHLRELLGHLTGDAAFQIGPGTGLLPVGATVMLGIDDPDAVSAWLHQYLPDLLAEADLPTGGRPHLTTDRHDGVEITSLGGLPPANLAWAVTDDALIAGISGADVAEAIDRGNGEGEGIAADPRFLSATARVPGVGSVLYVDVRSILSAVQKFLPDAAYQAFLDDGGKDLQPIEVIVAGASGDESATTSRLFIKVP